MADPYVKEFVSPLRVPLKDDSIQAMFHGYTESEWMRFSKGQRRVFNLMMDLVKEGYTDAEIRSKTCQMLEITSSCLRAHVCNIRKLAREIKRERAAGEESTEVSA